VKQSLGDKTLLSQARGGDRESAAILLNRFGLDTADIAAVILKWKKLPYLTTKTAKRLASQ
jgi:hypothetical protein